MIEYKTTDKQGSKNIMNRLGYAILLFGAAALNADQFSIQIYNDMFAGTDRHFTSGTVF